MNFGLRQQALLLCLTLLIVPVLGYRLVMSYEDHLIQGQVTALATEAALLANVVARSSRAELSRLPPAAGDQAGDLYAYPLESVINIDGKDDDWQSLRQRFKRYPQPAEQDSSPSLHFSMVAGTNSSDLYLYLRVTDDRVIYRDISGLSVHRNDHVQIATIAADGSYRRYTIAPLQPGTATAFLVAPVTEGSRAIRQEASIAANWLPTSEGYNVELRLPAEIHSTRLAVSVTDVDDPDTRTALATVGTASTSNRDQIGSLLMASRSFETALAGLNAAGSRLRLVDPRRRLLAQAGDIARAEGIWARSRSTVTSMFGHDLNPLVVDDADDPGRIKGDHIEQAIGGQPGRVTRPSSDGTATILATATPVTINSQVAAILVVEQTTNGALNLGNRLLTTTLNTAWLVIAVGALLFLVFVSVVARRIESLGQLLSQSIDAQGRVQKLLPAATTRDELGDLGRQFAEVAGRLHNYNRYLEDMSKRLAHELRTPVTVVRSSLDNLAAQPLDEEARVYMERATEGTHRLATILSNMTEATRLEESLDPTESEYFSLTEVVSGCVEGYRLAYPDNDFELSVETEVEKLYGLPELIAQMLDKLVSNAVEFSPADAPIKIRLTLEEDVVIRVINSGPPLPAAMAGRLFDSMISVRRGEHAHGTHLGLGLYIAKVIAQFHGGSISAHNREDTEGVIVTVRFPTLRITSRG